MRPQTIAAQGLGWTDEKTGAVVPGVQVATTFIRNGDNSYPAGFSYARPDNPAFEQPEAVLTALEKAEETLLFSSGMAAATAVFLALSPGDQVIVPDVMYWGLRGWLQTFAREWGLQVEFVDMSDLGRVRAAIGKGKTKLIWAETPANPMWTITDIAAVAEIAHAAGARLAIDSTVATPVLTRPIELGADIVMHSATKYLNGHSDVVAGTLSTRTRDDYWDRISMVRAQMGGIPGSFEAFLLTRGMRTLFPRVRAAVASAAAIAERLRRHPAVSQVLYPGLDDFPGHDIAARQMRGGFGAMISIRVKGGDAAAIVAASKVKIWKRATSLGSVESLIEHRASVEGAGTPVPGDLLRLSVGIEDIDDLIEDISGALAASR